ncbi:isochorismatase family protein [Akkermansiaceae bacterium]|nr:isochorismatase family protein [Akkermansiaceae bacterium]MDB4384323.1 isochorismatase family protein [Akkermansiaceae bacterium]MDB4541997.1 isochorismatase family protein [bacterium]
MKSILITQCLQNDFVKPIGKYDAIPNLLHIGYEESTRLMGINSEEGPIANIMNWAYSQPDDDLEIIHIRDWHDANDPKQKEHLAQFGEHCIQNTEGAEYAFPEIKTNHKVETVNSLNLNDFIDTPLQSILDKYKDEVVNIGIIGVWTEAKVSFLSYDIRTRYPNFNIAVCSALTAGSSVSDHQTALDKLTNILGVKNIGSLTKFTQFLNGSEFGDSISVSETLPILNYNKETNAGDVEEKIIRYLFRGCREVSLKVLAGGYSGNLVLAAKSIDMEGREEAPHVLKIGESEEMGQERMAFEKVEQVLGNTAPRITDFIDYKNKGGIKYRYASMGGGSTKTLQEMYATDLPISKIKKFLDTVFVEQLGKFYKAETFEKCNLLEYYMFDPARAERLKPRIEKVYEKEAGSNTLELYGHKFMNPYHFTKDLLEDLMPKSNRSTFFAYVHGDLNGANIMVDAQENIWLIDFFHTHKGHILKDLVKLENDLLYIYTKMESEEDFHEAVKLSEVLFNVKDLAKELPDVKDTNLTLPHFIKTYETVKILRSYYPKLVQHDRDPLQLLVSQLRYSQHTLIFFESNLWHKKWALYNSGKFCELITKKVNQTGPLRLDWIKNNVVSSDLLSLTIMPGRKDYSRSTDEDIKEIKKQGVNNVCIMVTDDELLDYGVSDLLEKYQDAGINVKRLPVVDQMVCSNEEMVELAQWTDNLVNNNEKILFHCVGGLGRSGMAIAAYLKYKGLESQEAINTVRKSRSPRAIESKIQEQFVHSFSF